VYVKDDTVFNESFATAVEEIGAVRWIATQNSPALEAQIARSQRLRAVFRTIVTDARAKLVALYASDASDEDKRAGKVAAFASMRTAYEQAKAGEPGLAGYDRWFAQEPNNASLAAVALYSDRVPAFRQLFAESDGDLARFYDRVRTLAALPKAERDASLVAAASRARVVAATPESSPAP
jgi:predicted aminopeptidase